ncbi:MAG TPA: hypothetical protein EYP04_13510 [Anaerolineae bacterium]|nr:hypothetical protein [Anaerolineae bacterium]
MQGCKVGRGEMSEIGQVEETVRSYLDIEFPLVGIQFLMEEVESDHPPGQYTFCQFVRMALEERREFVITGGDLSCPSAELALGFREPKYVEVEPRIRKPVRAVRIGPLEGADVVLMVLNPHQVMALAILLGGIKAEFRGEMALCGEAVAQVYNTGQPNVSFLCQGARELGGFGTYELVVGLPYETVLQLPERMTKFASLKTALQGKMAQLLRRF